MKKILWIDVETTGLNPDNHAMIELSMLMDIGGELVDKISLNIQPFPDSTVDFEYNGTQGSLCWDDCLSDEFSEAFNLGWRWIGKLPITNIVVGDIRDYLLPKTALNQITDFLDQHINRFDIIDKAYVGGYNVDFDIRFFSKFFERLGNKFLGSYINWRLLDPRYMLHVKDFKESLLIPNFKLATITKYFNLEHEAHDSLSDITVTRELFYKLLGE